LFGFKLQKKSRSKDELRLIKFIIDHFGHKPQNLALYKRALTHKSYSNSHDDINSNERLEFLGDAILDSIVADFLFQKFPQEDEGYLTKIKSKIVNRKTLSDIGRILDIGQFMQYNSARSINMATLEGNALEALIGAIYLDSNYDKTKTAIVSYLLKKHIDLNKLLEKEIDFKSKLFIWAQKNKLSLDFDILSEENDGNSWRYTSQVRINNQAYGIGIGTSKKVAEQEASKETLMLVGEF
jgi:ribonuclease-3